MEFYSNFRKNRAIKSYISKLPTLLVRGYGKSQKYLPDQIVAAVEYHGLNLIHVGFAIAIFSTNDEFKSYVSKARLKWKYKDMKKEVADKHFGGQTSFEIVFPKKSLYSGNADNSLRNYYFRNYNG